MNDSDRVVKIFISSTFREMAYERDEIQQIAFAKIRFWARKLGINVIPIDLRWGITHEDIVQGKLAKQCEDAIDMCSPYFIALLGNTYGTDAKSVLGIVDKKYHGKSVTDYEITKGVLELNNTKALIYNVIYSSSKESFRKRIKLKRLKSELSINNGLIDVNIRERLISSIVNDVEAMLLEEYASMLSQDLFERDDFFVKSAFYSQYYNSFFDLQYYSRYIDLSNKNYIVTADETDTVHYYMYNFAGVLQRTNEYTVLYHDFRLTSYSRDANGFIKHLIDSLYNDLGKYYYSSGNIYEDVLSAIAVYEDSDIEKNYVVFLDFLDVLDNTAIFEIVDFVRFHSFKRFSFVFSSFNHYSFYHDSFEIVTVNDLTEEEASLFIRCYLHEYKKDNNDSLTDEIVNHMLRVASYDISFLQLALNEILLRGCPSRMIVSEIDKLANVSSPTEMMVLIISRIINTMKDRNNSDNAVKLICILLSLCDEYLLLKDIVDMLSSQGYSHGTIMECLELLNDLISICDDQYQFRFEGLKSAVRTLFDKDIAAIDSSVYLPYFNSQKPSLHRIVEIIGYHNRYSQDEALIDEVFESHNFQILVHEDITRVLLIAKNKKELVKNYICNRIDSIKTTDDYDYDSLLNVLIICGLYDETESLVNRLIQIDPTESRWVIEKAYLNREIGDYLSSIDIIVPWIDKLDETNSLAIKAFDLLSYCYGKINRTSLAILYSKKAIEIRKNNLAKFEIDLPVSLNSLAYNYYRDGNYKKALNLYQESCNIRIKYYGIEHPRVANNMNNIGKVYVRQNRIEEAYTCFSNSYDLLCRTMGENHNYSLICRVNCILCEYILKKKSIDVLIKDLESTKHVLEARMAYNDYLAYSDMVYAIVCLSLPDPIDAKELLSASRSFYSQTFGNDCFEVAFIDNLIRNPNELEGVF